MTATDDVRWTGVARLAAVRAIIAARPEAIELEADGMWVEVRPILEEAPCENAGCEKAAIYCDTVVQLGICADHLIDLVAGSPALSLEWRMP